MTITENMKSRINHPMIKMRRVRSLATTSFSGSAKNADGDMQAGLSRRRR
jgi:hypothetical protein